ncbi:hypothetical protein FRC11_007131 [Ceratobasidium sp. 423]|nr:hypothetical protein FRC11_007131 [Ceratobasidium sp. 423]
MPDDSSVQSNEPQYQRISRPALVIDRIIEPQFKGSIFFDRNFFENFLPFVPSLNGVVELCLEYDWHLRAHHEWKFPDVINGEQCLHQPVLHILNTIKSAADVIRSSRPNLHVHTAPNPFFTQHPKYCDYHVPLNSRVQDLTSIGESFADWSSRDLAHALSQEVMHHLRPDIILFQGRKEHWRNIRFIVEIKEQVCYLAAGMKQLARYAQAVFAHQHSRRHFYSLLICQRNAFFVRFDRAGILYSRALNMVENPAFVFALASLLSLDDVDQGLDPAFKFEADDDYIELPDCMLGKDSRTVSEDGCDVRDVSVPMKTRRFQITERSYHPTRNRVTGPGTFIFRIREHIPPKHGNGQEADPRGAETQSPAEYTLKLSWRLDNGRSEGKALEEAEGTYGVPQHVSHGDIVMPGKCRCLLPPRALSPQTPCTTCVDRTPITDGLHVFENFQDLSVNIPLESGDNVVLERVDLDLNRLRRVPKSARANRIYSYVLVSSSGRPMHLLPSLELYLAAIIDAILGYWGLYNLGIVHRDISTPHLLFVTNEREFTQKRWEEARPQIKDPILAESEKELCRIMRELGRLRVIGHFYSIRVARMILTPDLQYRHHFYDDIESFFWVMLWTSMAHADPGKKPNEHAMKFLADFNIVDTRNSHIAWKEETLEDCRLSSGQATIARLNACCNEWASSFLIHTVLVGVGSYLGSLRKMEGISPPGEVFGTVLRLIQGELIVHERKKRAQKLQAQAEGSRKLST